MRRLRSLRQRQDIHRIYRQGKVHRGSLLIVRTFQSSVPFCHLALAARRNTGNAVVRNRIKRRLREAVRSLPVAAGVDILVTARSPASTASYSELQTELRSLLSKAGALEPTAI